MNKRILTLGLILGILLMCALPPLVGLFTGTPGNEGDLTVRLWREPSKETLEMDFSEYLAGCTAACLDFTVDYPEQALLAITVAEECKLLSVCGRCEHAAAKNVDFCDDPDHGSGYLGRAEAEVQYGKDRADELFSQIDSAVREVLGLGVCYGGELALTLMHESSYLLTEAADQIWGKDIPYLRSVRTYEEPKIREIEIRKDVASLLMQAGLGAKDAVPEIVSRTAAGRVGQVKLGDTQVSGEQFAAALMLPSTDFAVEETEESYLFTVRGGGNGVGLSRMGAVALAEQGYELEQILAVYYPGTVLAPIDVAALLALGRAERSGNG